MKSKEVLNLLRISRQTLTRYVSNGTIRVEVQPNKYYNYNDEDVYKILNKDIKRKIVIYARVSTPKQKKDLENQIDFLKSWCFSNGNQLNGIYSNVASGISFDKRKDFFAGNRIPQYCDLAFDLKTSENYIALNGQTAQQTLRIVSRSWKAFFKAAKEFSKHPDNFLGRPKPPGYKEKDGEFMLVFTNQQAWIENNNLMFPDNLGIEKIETRLEDDINLREVRIIPKCTGYVCEIVYEKSCEEGEINTRWYSRKENDNRIVGIDFGLRNIVTMANNIGEQPIVIKGGAIKSINQFYNKRKAQIQSIYDHQGIKTGTAVEILTENRNLKIRDAMHKISRYVVDWFADHNIGTIAIGHNDNWKQKAELGQRNNQNFVSIPYYILTNQIKYKAEEIGIKVIEQEESHTSKCSFLDNESIEHHEKYLGKRIKRGLFRSANGILINADVQGALNIIRKAFSNAFPQGKADGIEGVGLHPKRSSIFAQKIISFEDGC